MGKCKSRQTILTKLAKSHLGERGFTLMEMLIVIGTISIILSFSLFTLKSFTDVVQKRTFIHQLKADIYYAHSYAINRKETVVFSFSPSSNKYEAVLRDSGDLLLRRKFPNSIYIAHTNLESFTITPAGTVSNFGTVTFRQNQQTIKITFYIGRGRFSIEE